MTDWKEEILKKWIRQSPRKVDISDKLRDRLLRELKGEVFYKEPMSRHTSVRTGGIADIYFKPSDIEDIKIIYRISREENIPLFIHGLGSNTLVRDGGIRGIVVTLAQLKKIEKVAEGEDYSDVLVESGVGINRFVNFNCELGLTGSEALIGIPGSMGGAIAMNAGARGVEIKDLVREVTLLTEEGELKNISREKLDFTYRHLKISKGAVILCGLFRLKKGDPKEIAARLEGFQKRRVDTQPINYPNMGSVFKNPQTDSKKETKVYAAQLIEEAGLKNIRVGGARVSPKHANFIINEKDATAKDILVLIGLVKDKVKEKTGVSLELEVKVIGED